MNPAWGVDVRPLCWFFVALVAASATGRSLIKRNPNGCVFVCVISKPQGQCDLGPSWAAGPQKFKNICVNYFKLPSFNVIHIERKKEIEHRMSER